MYDKQTRQTTMSDSKQNMSCFIAEVILMQAGWFGERHVFERWTALKRHLIHSRGTLPIWPLDNYSGTD